VELNDNFVKVIEYEYAVRFLEHLGIEPTAKMITNLLKHNPLSSCELSSGWSNSGYVILSHMQKDGWLMYCTFIQTNKRRKLLMRYKEMIMQLARQ
jgi:hypothetical protein